MPSQIRPDDNNTSDWFREKNSASGIGITFNHDERQSF